VRTPTIASLGRIYLNSSLRVHLIAREIVLSRSSVISATRRWRRLSEKCAAGHGHRACGYSFELVASRWLERSDPICRLSLCRVFQTIGILVKVESNSPNHQNKIFLVSCHRSALQPLRLKGARKNYVRIPYATDEISWPKRSVVNQQAAQNALMRSFSLRPNIVTRKVVELRHSSPVAVWAVRSSLSRSPVLRLSDYQ